MKLWVCLYVLRLQCFEPPYNNSTAPWLHITPSYRGEQESLFNKCSNRLSMSEVKLYNRSHPWLCCNCRGTFFETSWAELWKGKETRESGIEVIFWVYGRDGGRRNFGRQAVKIYVLSQEERWSANARWLYIAAFSHILETSMSCII